MIYADGAIAAVRRYNPKSKKCFHCSLCGVKFSNLLLHLMAESVE